MELSTPYAALRVAARADHMELSTPYAALRVAALSEASRAARRRAVLVMLASSAALIALGFIAVLRQRSSSAPRDHVELLLLLQQQPGVAQLMPTITAHADEPASGKFDDAVPVVFMHGMGDSGSNPGMQSLCATASARYPGLYVVCANVANGLASVTRSLAEQVEEFHSMVTADAKLSKGFHAVGLSQGGLVLRGYVETKNDPPVRRFVSVCVPHAGIGVCPSSPVYNSVRARAARPKPPPNHCAAGARAVCAAPRARPIAVRSPSWPSCMHSISRQLNRLYSPPRIRVARASAGVPALEVGTVHRAARVC